MSESRALCGPTTGRPTSVSLPDGAVTEVAYSGLTASTQDLEYFSPERIGDHWIAGTVNLQSSNGGPTDLVPVIVGPTGTVRDLGSGFGRALRGSATQWVDLSSTTPLRSLCRPVRRLPSLSAARLGFFSLLQRVGHWTYQPTSGTRGRMQRCGSRKSIRTGDAPVFDGRFAAWLSGPAIKVRNLSRGTTRTYDWRVGGSLRPSLALTRDGLLVSRPSMGNDTGYRIARIPLS